MIYLQMVFDETDFPKIEKFLAETMNVAEIDGMIVESGTVHGELSIEQKLQTIKEEIDQVTAEIRGGEVKDVEDQDSPGDP